MTQQATVLDLSKRHREEVMLLLRPQLQDYLKRVNEAVAQDDWYVAFGAIELAKGALTALHEVSSLRNYAACHRS